MTEAFGDLIVLILLDKLSCELRRVLIRQNGSSDFDLDKLRKALRQEVEILDDSSDQKEPTTTHNCPFLPNSRSEETLPRPKPSTYQLEKAPHCQLCQGAHFVKSCTTFVTSDVRKAQAKKLNLCCNCLSDRHRVEVCTSSFRCRASGCGEQHHSALHSD